MQWFGSILAALILTTLVRAQAVDFNREVRPILASKCFQCHGPDDKVRKGGLRLDAREAALKELKSGSRAIVPGQPDKSELLARITATDDSAMPPASVGKRLTAAEISTLRRWIDQGAKFAIHWSYTAPVCADLPKVRDVAWSLNPIDRFILARLEREGLTPTPTADRYTLIRRLSIDLTGLPPSRAEVARFIADPAPDAYERLVDRILASPAYGERWAQVWLDLARYADSQGYANDPDRTIWRWRDWLITALNENRPFDRFTTEVLAGDLLKDATLDQVIATGFHRNTLTNTEGGTNPEEFRSAAIVDRVNTTMQVWMGTTIGCAQCHNHKYDPLSQREYYQLYSILNNTQDSNAGNDSPTLTVAVAGREEEYTRLSGKLTEARARLEQVQKAIDSEMTAQRPDLLGLVPSALRGLVARHYKADPKLQEKTRAAFRARSSDWKSLDALVKDLTKQAAALSTTTPVLKEGAARPTHIHLRGNFLDKGEPVSAGLPAVFPAPAPGKPLNRLTLAQWLVSPENPLTARVSVNRLWEEIFGTGIVETSEEFGMQGELPSHPDLLDWLATEFIRLGWDTKEVLRVIVTSAAYRQGSQVSPAAREKDPFNRLVSRGPRFRLSAESVRDQALAVSGLLSHKMYGPPVQPPKPNFGLSAAFGGTTDWAPSAGEDRWRRGLYTRVRRNAPYPSATTFDAPERTSCSVRRIRTNTPLQALVTLNDPVFVEAAQALARLIIVESGPGVGDRIKFAFERVLTRPPTPAELHRLTALVERAQADFNKNPSQAALLATRPLGPAPPGMSLPELAAWTVVGNVLLNLDETLAKP